ncbi:MAG: GntR family transcriptional regulator [Armatimonadetes bacterium]|nr:GntR family transcriptional regulator [Armatimonadota bacterium]
MAVRREIAGRKVELLRSLRQASQNGTWVAGDMVPTTRELAQQYGVSVRVVTQELQKLVEEGVLHTIPRVGTFVGRQFPTASEFYLMLVPSQDNKTDTIRQVQIGFEERVAALGAASVVMPLDMALAHRNRGELPAFSGVFDFAYFPGDETHWEAVPDVPLVGFSTPGAPSVPLDKAHSDVVRFDDIDGGRQATQHLLRLGHRRIAFLGLHGAQKSSGLYFWSLQRESGWCEVMQEAGHNTQGLNFHPQSEPVLQLHHLDRAEEMQVARETARALVRDSDISAVIAANDYAALGLFEALREAKIPDERWPSVVGFDDLPQTQSYVLTSLRLPWEEIGKSAVDLLWERKNGQLTGASQERRVRMRLLSRLTSRQNWTQGTNHAALAASLG